jgi:hypothetical protein
MPVAFKKSAARRIVRATLAVERAGASGGLRYSGRVPNSWSSNVYIGGITYVATGTRARYLWVYMDNPRAEWKSTTVSPMPPGVEIYDTHESAVHIPRFG